MERCRGVLPEHYQHGYAHFEGAMIEEFFFKCACPAHLHEIACAPLRWWRRRMLVVHFGMQDALWHQTETLSECMLWAVPNTCCS